MISDLCGYDPKGYVKDYLPASPVPRCALCYSYLQEVLDLGEQPLANALLSHPDDPSPVYPLRLGECPGCRHVQIMDAVPPAAMFSSYVYRTGASAPAVAHFKALAAKIRRALPTPAAVCEVGSGDGTLLKALRSPLLHAYGVDPSDAAADVPDTVNDYFHVRQAERLAEERGKADACVMANVLAHAPDPAGIVLAASKLVKLGGLLVIEAPYLYTMSVDQCYHEHQHIFSARALNGMLIPVGFIVERMERLSVHGGSLRVWARRVKDPHDHRSAPEWSALLGSEPPIYWKAQRKFVEQNIACLREACDYPNDGLLAAYGAPAKATVLLNLADIRPAYVTDSTPGKIGMWIPGVRVPIVDAGELERKPPSRVLMTAWNYKSHIIAARPELRGKWIIPFPSVHQE